MRWIMRAVVAPTTFLGLFLTAALGATPLSEAEQAAAWIYKFVGESPAVQRAIESAFGRGTPQALRLLSLPAEERGLEILGDEHVTSQILSSGVLTEKQQLGLAGATNLLHLSESSGRSERLLGFQSAAPGTASGHAILGDTGVKRTWSFTLPSGDVKIDPALTVPLLRFKGNQTQIEIQNIPGKVGLGAGAGLRPQHPAVEWEQHGRFETVGFVGWPWAARGAINLLHVQLWYAIQSKAR